MIQNTGAHGGIQEGVRVFFLTLGCAKNEVDTADMCRLLEAAGFIICQSMDAADVIVVNTCSFIQPAIEESIDAILDMLNDEGVLARGVPVAVAGCMPARYGSDLASEFPEVAAFIPCADEDRIVEIVSSCLGERASRHVAASTGEPEDFAASLPSKHFAYVKISDGCNRWCSYCTIPLIRGRYHSFSKDAIFEDVRRYVNGGVREIVLIGQDTGLWGADFDQPSSLAELLASLAEAYPSVWFRALYTQPENITDDLLSTIASHDNICPYLDIPLQHVDQSLLKAMNRTGSRKAFTDLVARIRRAIPGVAVRTTFITGFPGETEEMFDDLVSFVEEMEFDYVGVFPYSREEGTRAYELPCQVDEDEKMFRAEQLRSVADAVSSQVISSRIGCSYPVLVEGCEDDGQLYGRAIIQAPEVDGVTYVEAGCAGDVLDVVITDTLLYDMEA